MTFSSSNMTLEVFAPTLDDPITTAQTVPVSDTEIEFDNAEFFDIQGDPFNVVEGQFDAFGSYLRYTIIDTFYTVFANVTEFNGYVVTFTGVNIRGIEIVPTGQQLTTDATRITFDSDTIFVNVDALPFSTGTNLLLLASFDFFGGSAADFFQAGDGADALWGFAGSDTLRGGDGNNILSGGTGNDTMFGGLGSDTYYVDSNLDITFESDATALGGVDRVVSTVSRALTANIEELVLLGAAALTGTGNALGNYIAGNSAANTLFGLAGNDVLFGGEGSDRLVGGEGDDTMIGGGGNDNYYVDSILDIAFESASAGGIDRIFSSVSRTLGLNFEQIVLTGAATINATGNTLDNLIVGNDAANTLNGAAGDDYMIGATGNDTLIGGLGIDVMIGGVGRDTFVFNTAPNTLTNRDAIRDFSVSDDTMRLENAIFTALGAATGVLTREMFWASATGLAHDADDRVVYNTTTGALTYDSNGSLQGGAVQFAVLSTKPTISHFDFQVI